MEIFNFYSTTSIKKYYIWKQLITFTLVIEYTAQWSTQVLVKQFLYFYLNSIFNAGNSTCKKVFLHYNTTLTVDSTV